MNKKAISAATAIGLACLTLAGCVSEGGSYRGSDRFYDRGDRSDYSAFRGNRNRYPDRYRHDGRPDRDHGRPDRNNDSRRDERSSLGRDRNLSRRDDGNRGRSDDSGSGRLGGDGPIILRNR